MTYQEEMERLEKAMKSWQTAVRFHERSLKNLPRFKSGNLEKAKAGLARVEAAIDDLKRARRDEEAHEELMYIPLFTKE